MVTEGRRTIETPGGPAWADVQTPAEGASSGLLVLGHGSGGSVDAPDLQAVLAACLQGGIAVAAVTQPYRVAGRRNAAPAPRLDEAWLAVVAALRADPLLGELRLVQGGRSSGARVACRTATAAGARGVLALAFPLHPPGRPGRPGRSRQDELDRADVPVLVVQGESDPFGVPEPSSARGRRRTVVVVPGDHALRRQHQTIAAAAVRFVRAHTR